ncbi:MAG TPA: xanthine dehydrogenase family protein subunit M [Candidatus Dormibacteraeota bacterium]|jgi:xanthine dehydrogenase YagS FAD-binding subunit|nr:xanthine dehydrogenase family protein subunit M [Candidatus Dormibacteraeota bacterium]
MKPFAYAKVATADEAAGLLKQRNTRVIAGGTDLLGLMKERLVEPDRLVDLSGISQLRGISATRETFRVGALTTLAELAAHQATPPIVKEALADAATPQLRNMATVGGNLVQRNRCWYFRSAEHRCWLKGGPRCLAIDGDSRYHAIFGEGECRQVTPSDLVPALIALDATVVMRTDEGEDSLPLAQLYVAPTARHRREHNVGDDDLIVAVRIGGDALHRRGAYLKFMERATWQFAIASVAVSAGVVDGRAQDVRIVAGGVANVPWRVKAAEDLLTGERIDDARALAVAERFVRDARPLRDNAYKVTVLRELVRRGVLRLRD